MKFQVVCNQPGRIRFRFGKYVFTKEQCYGFTQRLLSFDGVLKVHMNEANGSLLVIYKEKQHKEALILFLEALRRSELVDGLANLQERSKRLEREFRNKVAGIFVKGFLRQLFLPSKIRHLLTCYRAIPYIRAGLRSIRQGQMDVELLDATAIGASLCYGHYKTAASTMVLLKLSDLLFEYSNARTKNELSHSLAIHIEKVWVVRDGIEEQVLMKEVGLGDILRIRRGSVIPVDGTVAEGEGFVNESTMTGESQLVRKQSGSTVFAGTVVEEGEIDVSARALGSGSQIAKIMDMIDHGEEAKANIQGKAERLADGIVPISFALFLATLGLSKSIQRALSVLMVDFSCAIKLTTPITIISALKEASQRKVVVKGGKYLELLSQVDTVIFDKTGTLTHAVPKVSKVISTHDQYSKEDVLRIAACLEEHFPHSVAMAIVEEAAKNNLVHPEHHEKVEYVVAHGIVSSYKGVRSLIGSYHFVFDDEGVPFPKRKSKQLTKEIGNDSAVYLAVDNQLVGVICVNDPPREDAKETIDALRHEGIDNIMMITGDSEGTAANVSQMLGIDQYYSSVLPEGKAAIINELKAQGRTVLMVGDGINDTPALSCADVSMTLNGSSDIAREVSDITILSNELQNIVVARRMACAMMEKIARHYHWIASFNTLLILAGIGGFLHADQSAWLHNTSTLALAGASAKPVLKPEGKKSRDDS